MLSVSAGHHVRDALRRLSAGGTAKWKSGDIYAVGSTADDTNGPLGFVVASVPAGKGRDTQAHARHDQAFYLLEGELEFLEGDRTFIARADDFVFVPRGVRHRFKNVSSCAAKMAFFFNPDGRPNVDFRGGGDTPSAPSAQLSDKRGAERFAPEFMDVFTQLGNIRLVR